MNKREEWWSKLPKEYRDWVYGQGQVIRNNQHPTKLAYRAWKFQQDKIQKLEKDNEKYLDCIMDHFNENRALKYKIQKLEKSLEVARECNEFYAESLRVEFLEGEIFETSECDTRWQEVGYHARQTEKQIKEILGSEDE